MKKALLLLCLNVCTLPLVGQNWFPVATESNTSVTVPAGTYRFGTNNCSASSGPAWASFATTAQQTFSMYWDPWPWPVADPCMNVTKELDIAETAIAQTITVAGATVTVPADPVLAANCASTPQPNWNPAIPAVPANCPLATGAVAIATDGQYVLILTQDTPAVFQYCWGAVCNAPFVDVYHPYPVGPTAQMGGPPVSGGAVQAGTLYALPGSKFTYVVASGPQLSFFQVNN